MNKSQGNADQTFKDEIKERGGIRFLLQAISDKEEFAERLENYGRTREEFRVKKIVEFCFYNFKFLILLLVIGAAAVGYRFLMTRPFLKSLHGDPQTIQAIAIIAFVVSAVLIIKETSDYFRLIFLSRGQMRQTKALRDELGDLNK